MKIGLVGAFFDEKDVDLNTSGGNQQILRLIEEWRLKENNVNIIEPHIKFTYVSIFDFLIRFALKVTPQFPNLSINRAKFDIILGASPYPPDLIRCAYLHRKLRRPTFVYFHHIVPSILWKPMQRGFLRVLINRAYLRFAIAFCIIFDLNIFLDQPNEYEYGSLKIHSNGLALIKPQKSILDALGRIPKTIDLFYIGRISKNKGILQLVKAISLLRKDTPLNVVVAGSVYDKDFYRRVLRYIKKHELSDSIHFIGVINEEEKYSRLAKSKAFVFPSFEEGWGLSVMEAAMMKVPIIALDLIAYSYLEGNYFKADGNYRSLAAAISECFTDLVRRKEYVKNAFALVMKYNYPEIAEGQLRLFRSALDAKSLSVSKDKSLDRV